MSTGTKTEPVEASYHAPCLDFFFSNYIKAREMLALQDSTGLTMYRLKNMHVLNFGNSASFYSQPNLIKPDNKRLELESYSGEIKM